MAKTFLLLTFLLLYHFKLLAAPALSSQSSPPTIDPTESLDDPADPIEKVDPWPQKSLELKPEVPIPFLQNVGMHATYSSDSMTTQFIAGSPSSPKTVEAKMKGTGVAFGIFYEKFFSDRLSLLGGTGIDQFYVETNLQDHSCSSQTSTHCFVNIQFLSTYGMTKYYLLKNSSGSLWLGFGGAFLIALTKSSSVLDTHRMGVSGLYLTSLGMNFNFSKERRFIPLEVGYSQFPPNSTVTTNRFFFRTGYGWRF